MAQQMGFFNVDDPAECNKPKHPETDDHSTPAYFLAHGAVKCCKSQKPDQTVCKVDKCVSGMMKCFESHAHEIEASEKKLTNPKAMDENDEGEMEGSCPVAILNRVEGALCCTAAMEKMIMCVSREVGDYKVCKESWDKAFEPDFFQHAEAVMESFKTGGYCASIDFNATIGTDKALGCPKCGSSESGKRSCCAPGGSWSGNCGNAVDSNFDHTWFEGIAACASEPTTAALAHDRRINGKPCLVENIMIVNQGCVKGSPHYDSEGMVCANDGKPNEAYCSYEVGNTTCAYCQSVATVETALTTVETATVSSLVPCDQLSDFNGNNSLGDGHTCQGLSAVLLPWSPSECNDKPGEGPQTKAMFLKYLYGRCCKPGSKPNEICGLELTLPCDQASDFEGGNIYHDEQTCQDISALVIPNSAGECSEKLGDSSVTRGDSLKHAYSMCCKPGSKPNGICGFKLSAGTPCESKADGEFIPETK